MNTQIFPSTTTNLLLRRFDPGSITYSFSGAQPVLEGAAPLESAIAESIRRNNTDLRFQRTVGIFKGDFLILEKRPVYQFKYPAAHMFADFLLYKWDGQNMAEILMLVTDPNHQGNFYTLKDFLIRRVALTLFDAGIFMVTGKAMPNTYPVRKKPDSSRDFRCLKTRDGTPNLVRLYEHLGFSRQRPGSNVVFLTREAFNRVSSRPQRPLERL